MPPKRWRRVFLRNNPPQPFKKMFRFFGCAILALYLLASNAVANTTIYQKDNFKVNITGYLDGQSGSKDGLQTRHNIYGGLSVYDKVNTIPVSVALRVNSGSNASESYGGTAIEDAYLRVGDGSTDSDDRFLSFKEQSSGRFELGITGPISEKLRVSSTSLSRGTGGVSGDWFRYVKYNLDSSTTILNPQMPITNGFTTSTYASTVTGVLQDYYSGSQALKANFYTPKFNGFLLGVGFTPSLYDRYAIIGLQKSYAQMTSDANNNFNTKNSISSVLHFDEKISEDFHLTSSLMWEHGQVTQLNKNYDWKPRENLNAWMFGVTTTYQNKWHLGGSYSSYGKSLYFKNDGTANTMQLNRDGSLSNFAKAYFYDLGIGFGEKTYGASLTYFVSNYAANQVSTAMLSLDKSFMLSNSLGFRTYIETGYSQIKHSNFYDGVGNIKSNTINAGLIFAGARLMF